MTASDVMRVAVLDMNKGTKNLGIPSILNILDEASSVEGSPNFAYEVFDVRAKDEVPDLRFDLYISSGGPGSPFAGRGRPWERAYFHWLESLWSYNESADVPKHALFICHSFEMLCDFFDLAEVTRRKSPSFGIYPVYKEGAGIEDPLFEHLDDPFWGADFRRWQVIQPNESRMEQLDASILALEKVRPHVPLERAVMGIRIGQALVGVQFHPEAAPDGMRRHFRRGEKRQSVIEEHGVEKYEKMLDLLDDPSPLAATRRLVIPNFLHQAVSASFPVDTNAH